MVKRGLVRKMVSLAISALLIFLIFFILVPPATAVKLSPGTPSSTSVNTGTTITFSNVNLTIRGVEKIPVNFLNFTVYKSNDDYAAHVKFYINGTEITDYPSGKFTVTNTTTIGDSWYSYGYQNGTDEETSQNYNFGYGYGYGYGGASGYIDITFLYDIVYTTHATGTFYAKLSVNSTNHTYASSNSQTFTVTSPGGGGGPSLPPTEEEEEEEETETSENIINDIEEQYDIMLEVPFYANDTDEDGLIDTFTDPNGVLTSIHSTTVDGNTSFLISVDDDEIPEFFWDTQADTITSITHDVGDIVDIKTDTDEKNITVTVSIEKANWTYIEVTDSYPDNLNLTVKTSDGRNISSDKIWRKNNKIYVLDDPVTEYLFIYRYEPIGFLFDVILELITDSVFEGEDAGALITLINVGEPGLVNGTVTHTLSKNGVIIWSEEENVSVLGQKAYNKTISTEALSSGEYIYEVVYSYGDNQTASSQSTFTVKAKPPAEEFPLWIIAVLVVILLIIIIIAFLFKTVPPQVE